jgi:hypothetical protein
MALAAGDLLSGSPGGALTGLEPRRAYQVEIGDEEMYEAVTDPAGILELDLPHDGEVGVRMGEAR